MKLEILEVLRCPHCEAELHVTPITWNEREIREGHLTCAGTWRHFFEIKEGIVHLGTGFDHDLVQKELAYENSTYHGSPRLTDNSLIAHFPETLPALWPHTAHFGPDFKALIDKIGIRPGQWVLDVGTGPCWSSRLLAQHGARVIALDINEADFYGLKTSDRMFAAHAVYFERVLESMTNLPFADGSMDRITFNASFHHTPDHHKTLRECFRVLKAGGVLAMVNEEFASVRQYVFGQRENSDTGSHHQIAYAEFQEAAAGAGFHLEFCVAAHVRNRLKEKFSGPIGGWMADTLERVPLALKQLNSALILLNKPARVTTPTLRSEPSFAHHE